MSKRNRMPGLRLKGGIWQIEKRCREATGGWLRESTGTSSRNEAEKILIRRLEEIRQDAVSEQTACFTFEQAGLRYIEEVSHKSSADTIAMHLDQLFPFIGDYPLSQVHDGTVRSYVDHDLAKGKAPKSVNNGIGVISAVLNRAARVWLTEHGLPWLMQAPPRLTRLSLTGKQARLWRVNQDEKSATIWMRIWCREFG